MKISKTETIGEYTVTVSVDYQPHESSHEDALEILERAIDRDDSASSQQTSSVSLGASRPEWSD